MLISFRDPAGHVAQIQGRVFRFITDEGKTDINHIFQSSIVEKLIENNGLVSYSLIELEQVEKLLQLEEFSSVYKKRSVLHVLEHQKISFPSYPYEWAPEMLHAAGNLTISIADKILEEDLGIKDATPYNILFEGNKPIFIDLLSIEKRNVHDPIWLAYAQFLRMFLLPLLLNRFSGMSLAEIFTMRSFEGVQVDECVRYIRGIRKWHPLVLSLVTMPYLLANRISAKSYQKKKVKNPELAKFILRSLYKRTKRCLKQLTPKDRTSHWTDYMDHKDHYSEESFVKKEDYFKKWINDLQPKKVLDVGCNTGHFSQIAADTGAKVVAIDSDEASIGVVFRKKRKEILPLVVNLCRPTPSIGWKNAENSSFLKRAKGHFDLIIFLAVIHHMLVTERVPLEEIASLCAELTTNAMIIEYIDPKDRMFQQILHGREHLHANLTVDIFRKTFKRYFHLENERPLTETRFLFLLRKVQK